MTQFILFFLKASQRMTAWHVNGLARDYFQFLLRAQTPVVTTVIIFLL